MQRTTAFMAAAIDTHEHNSAAAAAAGSVMEHMSCRIPVGGRKTSRIPHFWEVQTFNNKLVDCDDRSSATVCVCVRVFARARRRSARDERSRVLHTRLLRQINHLCIGSIWRFLVRGMAA
jgi:hypothetical protein